MNKENQAETRKDPPPKRRLFYVLIGLFSIIVFYLLYMSVTLWVSP
ncbi:hypothetical protein SDC9_208116 [bioreactor metagenome]|uniref:Uncharacterized protein n=1 Tax=bioreactor metagenome TaxID=1076179 RepID=A0A645J9Q6_9ZZZZ